MRGRTARRLAMDRYLRWMIRNRPEDNVPRCLERQYNRQVRKFNRRLYRRNPP